MKTFTARTKSSLVREDVLKQSDACCTEAGLTGFFLVDYAALEKDDRWLSVRSASPGVIRWAVKRLRSAYGEVYAIGMSRKAQKIHIDFQIEMEAIRAILQKVFACSSPPLARLPACCRDALIRGAYLRCGMMMNPALGYRLEFVLQDEPAAKWLSGFIQMHLGVRVFCAKRRGMAIAYVKRCEDIIAVLSSIGANQAILEMESSRILRDARNRANRASNCDTGNIAKMIGAADRQIQAIALIERTIGIHTLPEPLRDIAIERERHPDISLEELGALVDPPMGKSGVYHRLRRIEAIAHSIDLSQKEGEYDT